MIATRTLEGERVRLRPWRESDAPMLSRWYADREVVHWLHRSEDPPTFGSPEVYLAKIRELCASDSEIRFIVETGALPVGDIGLTGIHPCGRAELSIAFGEKVYWAKGLGRAAIRVLLAFGFEALDLRRISLVVDADNARGIRCYEAAGFRSEGTLRAHRLRYGKPLDMLAMAILREDFYV